MAELSRRLSGDPRELISGSSVERFVQMASHIFRTPSLRYGGVRRRPLKFVPAERGGVLFQANPFRQSPKGDGEAPEVGFGAATLCLKGTSTE